MSESVNPSILQQLREALSLLHGESCCFFIALGTGNVNLLMADIKISTKNGSFLFPQLFQVLLETFVPVLYSVT